MTSASHSQANHGALGLLNENKSWEGTERISNIYSPVRMCQPVSPSASKEIQPLPSANTQMSNARKRQSESDGTSRAPARRNTFIEVNRNLSGQPVETSGLLPGNQC